MRLFVPDGNRLGLAVGPLDGVMLLSDPLL
jgi:hypothetical protein